MCKSSPTDYLSIGDEEVISENKVLGIGSIIKEILQLDSFDIDNYKIFKSAVNSWDGTRGCFFIYSI